MQVPPPTRPLFPSAGPVSSQHTLLLCSIVSHICEKQIRSTWKVYNPHVIMTALQLHKCTCECAWEKQAYMFESLCSVHTVDK